jgi:uracil phosphoribosyltransferase
VKVATAGTAIASINILKDWGLKNIIFVCILASSEGLESLKSAHPDVVFHCGYFESNYLDLSTKS